MRKLLLVLVLFIGCGSKAVTVNPPPPVNADWTITAVWSYDFTNYMPCSSTVTVGCISGFTWGYLQGTNHIALKTSLPATCTGSQPESCTDSANSMLGIGSVTFYIIPNYISNAGGAGSGPETDSAPQTVSAAAVPSLTVTFQ